MKERKQNGEEVIQSLIETHLKSLSEEDGKELREWCLERRQLLRFPMQVTYDFYG